MCFLTVHLLASRTISSSSHRLAEEKSFISNRWDLLVCHTHLGTRGGMILPACGCSTVLRPHADREHDP